MRDELMAVADRVEALTGPDRAVDAEIAKAVGAPHGPKEIVDHEARSVDCIEEQAPAYTASIDAAETLRPDGWNWMAGERDQGRPRAYVNNGLSRYVGGGMERNPHARWFEVVAATPAIALTAAALRARASEVDQR